MAWSKVTAGGSATTWSAQTAGGSSTTWTGGYSVASVMSFGWIPYGPLTDLWDGRDFAPKASAVAPYKSMATGSGSGRRPLAVWNQSSITASAFTAEGAP